MTEEKYFLHLPEKHREEILAAERYLWNHPETGYKEWKTTEYLAGKLTAAGYELNFATDIPGFYTDIDTGIPGPKILVLAEMDALYLPSHPEQKNSCVHACGHHAQCAAMLGLALALKEPGALDGLCGSIRLCAVPAEELIELEFRESLRKQKIISYPGGKTEYLYRGYFDGCDIAFSCHASTLPGRVISFNDSNGFIVKEITFKGRASHAAANPGKGINALYAAMNGLNALNSIRETFSDDEHVRIHPVVSESSHTVNSIPDTVLIQTYIRGASIQSIKVQNKRVNQALAGGALSLGASVHIKDSPGYAPLVNNKKLIETVRSAAAGLIGEKGIIEDKRWDCGSTDLGDLSNVMRCCQINISGAVGTGHSDDYVLSDPEMVCVNGAGIFYLSVRALLENGAVAALDILENTLVIYQDKWDYFHDLENFRTEKDLITYTEKGAMVIL